MTQDRGRLRVRAIAAGIAAAVPMQLASAALGGGLFRDLSPAIALGAVMGWFTWRRGLGLEPFPPRLWIGLGTVLLVMVTLLAVLPGNWDWLDWVAGAALAVFGLGLLWKGSRMRRLAAGQQGAAGP